MKKVLIRKNTLLALLAAALILLAGAAYGLIKAVNPGPASESVILYGYSVSAGASYEVSLIENELYPEGVLGEDRLYARSLADRLNIAFTADYSGDQAAPVSGDYSINIIVQGYQNSGDNRKLVYERDFPLVENKPVRGEGSVQIAENVSLDINAYKEFADQAEQILNAKPSREATVQFHGTFAAQSQYGEVKEPFSYTLQLPLSSELFAITKEAPFAKTDAISETREAPVQVDFTTAAVIVPAAGLLLTLAAILVLLFLTRRPTAQEQYALDFKAIKRKHGSRMAKLNALPSIPAKTQIEINDLDTLVKIADERQQFICYFPNEEGLPMAGLLYVPDTDKHYLLYLK